eukprot:366336-Chlamydomonas_euryale.AAC.23
MAACIIPDHEAFEEKPDDAHSIRRWPAKREPFEAATHAEAYTAARGTNPTCVEYASNVRQQVLSQQVGSTGGLASSTYIAAMAKQSAADASLPSSEVPLRNRSGAIGMQRPEMQQGAMLGAGLTLGITITSKIFMSVVFGRKKRRFPKRKDVKQKGSNPSSINSTPKSVRPKTEARTAGFGSPCNGRGSPTPLANLDGDGTPPRIGQSPRVSIQRQDRICASSCPNIGPSVGLLGSQLLVVSALAYYQ